MRKENVIKGKKAKATKKSFRFGTYFMASFLVFKRSDDER